MRIPAIERFVNLVNGPWCDPNVAPNDCWLWMGGRAECRRPRRLEAHKPYKRYGRFWDGERLVNAHRAALILFVGEPPDPSYVAAHVKCDRPLCCNFTHLAWKSPAGNILEAIEKGHLARSPLGFYISLGAAVIA